MNIAPQSKELANHISHYWVVNNTSNLFQSFSRVYGYPGIRPEMILILKGHLTYTYLGELHHTNKSILASHIHSNFLFDSSNLEQFVIVQFKPRSVASLLPFTKFSSKQLMENTICNLEDLYGNEVAKLESALIDRSAFECVEILDTFFSRKLNTEFKGFIAEMTFDLPISAGISNLLEKTGYSISTLERYVKSETGMTPKSFLSLKKYKAAVEEIHETENYDWQYYVAKYNYTDQSHFIKTIKRFTGFTPTQLVKAPNLIRFRPE